MFDFSFALDVVIVVMFFVMAVRGLVALVRAGHFFVALLLVFLPVFAALYFVADEMS